MLFFVNWLTDSGDKFHEFKLFIPRFFLALLISLSIAVPIELLIFEAEITEEISLKESNAVLKSRKLIDQTIKQETAPLIEENNIWKKIIQDLTNAVALCEKEVQRRQTQYICERNGTCGTEIKGCGPECEVTYSEYMEKKKQCSTSEANASDKIKDLKGKIKSNTSSIELVTEEYSKKKIEEEKLIRSNLSYSFLARVTTLGNLSEKSSSVKFAIYIITLLIFVMELTPILIKIMSKYGAYEECLESLNCGAIKEIREEGIRLTVETKTLKKKIKNMLSSAEEEVTEYHIQAEEEIRDFKAKEYRSTLKSGLLGVSHETSFQSEIISDIKKFLSMSSENKGEFNYKPIVFSFSVGMFIILSLIIYASTKDILHVKKYVYFMFFVFNFFLVYKKIREKRSVDSIPSPVGS